MRDLHVESEIARRPRDKSAYRVALLRHSKAVLERLHQRNWLSLARTRQCHEDEIILQHSNTRQLRQIRNVVAKNKIDLATQQSFDQHVAHSFDDAQSNLREL